MSSRKSGLSAFAPVRFETDKRAWGMVHFPRPAGKTRLPLEPLQQALGVCLGVRVDMKRQRLFGPKVPTFSFMGENVRIKILDNGNACLDLGHVDDEVRETILEHLRTSFDFDGR